MDTQEPVRPPTRQRGRPSEVADEAARLDPVPWEGIGPGDSLGSEVPRGRRHERHWRGEPWVRDSAGAGREVKKSWNGEETTRTDTGKHRPGTEPR